MTSTSSEGLLGAIPVVNVHDPTTMYSRTAGWKFIKNKYLFYKFCKIKGHTKDICYKLVGFPTDTRFKKKGGSPSNNYKLGPSATGPSAHNACSERYKETHDQRHKMEILTSRTWCKLELVYLLRVNLIRLSNFWTKHSWPLSILTLKDKVA